VSVLEDFHCNPHNDSLYMYHNNYLLLFSTEEYMYRRESAGCTSSTWPCHNGFTA